MEIKVLASGSKGNCYKVSNGDTSLLIEAGISIKNIQIGCDFKLSAIDGCLISHSHRDHSKSAQALAKMGVDIYTSQGTIDTCKLTGHRVHAISAHKDFWIGTWNIYPLDVQHDTPEPLGFVLTSEISYERLLFFTDTYYLKYKFSGITHIMGEANYDQEALLQSIQAGYVPIELASRLMKSHMSLDTFLELLRANDLSKIQHIYLLHLSDNNSNELRFKDAVQRATGAQVHVC
jgi:phosphoribosyl 1,2-cyclic phosphodiesterase